MARLLKGLFSRETKEKQGKNPVDATVYETDATVPEADATIYEDDATIPEDDATVYEEVAASPDSAASPSSAAELSYERGETIFDTYTIASDPIYGGMGSVWRVHHNAWNVDLAMKRPQAKLFQSERQKENFIGECEAWINLGLHPNIVSCYYVREIGGVPTIFSEWMENGSLENHIRKGTLYTGTEQEQQERLLDIGIQFERGLHYAHEQGLIHQDVKPDNLLLSKDWDAKVADFGLAKARAQLTISEGSNIVIDAGATVMAPSGGYTPAYCSMEQMDGKPLTRRTDIYSWAVSVMEMYIGSRPWMNGVVAGLSCKDYFGETRVPMPEVLKELLAKCMAAEPEDRPHDFAEVDIELLKIYRSVIGNDYPRPVSDAAADTADSLNNLALSYLDLGQEERAETYWQQALEKEPGHLSAVYNYSLLLWRNGIIDAKELERRCGEVFEKESETGDRLRPLLEAEAEDALPKYLYKASNDVVSRKDDNAWRCAAISPDGRYIYVLFESLCCFDAHTFEKRYENADAIPSGLQKPYPNFLLITHDGKYLIFSVGYETDIWVAEASTGQILRVLRGHRRGSVLAGCVHPYEDILYTSGEDRTLRRWNVETGECEQVYNAFSGSGKAVGWMKNICVSPADHRLYASATSHGIAVWDEQSGEALPHLMVEIESPCGSIAVSPDGKILYAKGCVICTSDGSFRESDALSEMRRLWLSPDGKKLLIADIRHVMTLWDTEKRQRIRTFGSDENVKGWKLKNIVSISASSDLSIILSSNVNKCVLVYDPEKEIRYSPWELSVIRTYSDQRTLQQEIEAQILGIESQIAGGNPAQAVMLLEQAEEHFPPHLFHTLRRKLSAQCRHGKLKDIYEIVTFEAADQSGNPWEGDQNPAADPGGGIFASTEKNYGKNIYVYTETGKRIKKITSESEFSGLGSPKYSPSGRLMAVGGHDYVMIFDMKEMTLKHTLQDMPRACDENSHPIDFSPDGRMLLVAGDEGYLAVWDPESGERIKEFERGRAGFLFAAFTDKGRKAVALDMDRCLNVFDVDGGKLLVRKELDSWIGNACFSADGSALYLWLSWNERIGIIDTKTLNVCEEIQPELGDDVSLCVSPDASVLASAGNKGVKLWSLPDKKLLWELPELKTKGYSNNMAFSPDGCVLCVGTGINVHMLMLRYELIAE